MTDAQIELAARRLCTQRGYNPEAPIGAPHPYPAGATVLWEAYVPEIKVFAEIGTAIASVMAIPVAKKRAAPKRKPP